MKKYKKRVDRDDFIYEIRGIANKKLKRIEEEVHSKVTVCPNCGDVMEELESSSKEKA